MSKRNRFLEQPNVRYSRSLFDLSHDWIGSCDLGTLYPCLVQEILPGDSFKIGADVLVRLASNFYKPLIGDVYADIYFFNVPNRLVFNDSDKVFANPEETEYSTISLATYPANTGNSKYVSPGSIADYMGLPPYTEFGASPSAGYLTPDISLLPFRSFALIWNNWFRDENTVGSVYVQKGAAVLSEAFNSSPWAANNYTGMPPTVGKYHDYFTSCLPNSQKGPLTDIYPAQFAWLDTSSTLKAFTGSVDPRFGLTGTPPSTTIKHRLAAVQGSALTYGTLYAESSDSGASTNVGITGTNLGVTVPALDISTFRFQAAYAQLLERLARGGSRYTEFINSMFGVTSPDARLQIPEYLGGRRIRLNVQQVAQTAPGTGDGVGSLQGYSLTVGKASCNKAFVEHSFLIGVICFRQKHLYQQGVQKFWTRRTRNDYHMPLFDHLSEQPVMTTELYGAALKTSVFGFNEAWADYRFGVSKVVGQMRSTAVGVSGNSFDMWHAADWYTSPPVLTSGFIQETPDYFDRTVVGSAVDQFIVDIHFDVKAIRVMSKYSVPGMPR